MIAMALPFMWIGAAMTLRPTRSANAPPWMVILYALGLFVALPICLGFLSVLIFNSAGDKSAVRCVGTSSLSVLIPGVALLALGKEGLVCLAVALPLALPLGGNGDQDGQKQAADMMEKAMAEEGLRLIRVIGPKTRHRYHPDSIVEINRILDAIAERGRDPYPRRCASPPWTLAHNEMKWVTIDPLGKHWERARLDAEIVGDSGITVATSNVAAFTLDMGPGGCPLDLARKPRVTIDGQKVSAPMPMSDRLCKAHFRPGGK